jgi:hypothetical protein
MIDWSWKVEKTSERKKAGGLCQTEPTGLSRGRKCKRVIQNKTKRNADSEDAAGIEFARTTAPQAKCVEGMWN